MASSHSLFKLMAPHLDHHLVLPLLEFEGITGAHSEEVILKSSMELLSHTHMVDLVMDKYKELHKTDKVPKEYTDKRTEVIGRLKGLKEACAPLLAVVNDKDLVKQLKEEKTFTLQYLTEKHQVTQDHVDALYVLAKFYFECGQYEDAGEFLSLARQLGLDQHKNYSALWGVLACSILSHDWDAALDNLTRLREMLDTKQLFTSQVLLLQHRRWFIHYALFVFFEHPDGRSLLLDVLMQDRYIQTIQCDCPHILRYLAAAVIVTPRRRGIMAEVVRVVQQEHDAYADPITEFLECILVKFDFEGAQTKLRECEDVLKHDYFLDKHAAVFIDSARLLLFRTYCQIHQTVNIEMLATKLNMTQEEAELWIANLIRNAGLDARIDAESNHVIMGTHQPSVYQQVIEKTRGLAFRTFVLTNNIERRARGHEDNRQHR